MLHRSSSWTLSSSAAGYPSRRVITLNSSRSFTLHLEMERRNRLLCLTLLCLRRKRRNHSAATEQPSTPRKQKGKESKRIWAHAVHEQRVVENAFANLFHDLRMDENKFFDYFRMSISTFDELLYRIGTQIEKQNTQMRDAISPAERLAVTLRYLAAGSSFEELHHEYRMGTSTIAAIVRDVCDSILHCFSQTSIPPPTVEKFESVAAEFEKKTQFPHCIGAIGIKYIKLVTDGALSLVAVADSDYRFLLVDIDLQGSYCNSTLFEETKLWENIINNILPLPEPKLLSASINKCVPYVFLGNEGFGIQANLMRPFSGNCLTEKKKIFNNRLSKARKYIDGAFAILSNKWRILHRPLSVKTDLAMNVVKVCCVLHNFVRERDGFNFDDTLTVTGLRDVGSGNCHHGKNGADTRQIFTDYFVSNEGSVP